MSGRTTGHTFYIRRVIITIDDFFQRRGSLPVVDVRSEGEFEAGHIPGAVNIPLLNNAERIVVGTTYKQQGQKAAIREGFRLVGPRLKDIVGQAEKVGSEFIVHCWRGGMRSANFCDFVRMIGIRTHAVKGGYKAYRKAVLDSFTLPFQFRIISGLTGSGKSDLLRALRALGEQVIDFEGLARHKGSVFGGLNMPPQPTTEQFQNDLFEQILNLDITRPIWIEDESIAIGKIFLPSPLWKTMNAHPIIRINVPMEERLARLVQEYGQVPPEMFIDCMKGILKRLGGQNFNEASEKLRAGDPAGAIEIVLTYYDKAYGKALERKRERVARDLSWDGKDVSSFAQVLSNEALTLSNVSS